MTPKERKEKKIILVGDLVTHVLYAKDWLGFVLSIKEEKNNLNEALLQMLPGSEYEFFFEKRFSSQSRSRGWISTRWLLKL